MLLPESYNILSIKSVPPIPNLAKRYWVPLIAAPAPEVPDVPDAPAAPDCPLDPEDPLVPPPPPVLSIQYVS
jgi:hypothetical protein